MRYPLPVLFICGLAFAVPSPSGHVVFERRQVEPHGWVQSRRLEGDFMLPMRFGLIQNNLDHLDDMLMAVSHPDSAGYSKHWSATDLVEKFKPTTQTIEEVVRWLVDSGIPHDRLALSINRGWIHFNATTAEVEELLKTEYYVFTHEDSGVEQISANFPVTIIYPSLFVFNHQGCQSYSIPARMEKHIDLIMPTVHFNNVPSPMVQRKRTGGLGALESQPGPHRVEEDVTVIPTLAKCDMLITMECLRALYNIDYTPVATEKNSFGIG
jgi:tripeptidyl-peptidase-1